MILNKLFNKIAYLERIYFFKEIIPHYTMKKIMNFWSKS